MAHFRTAPESVRADALDRAWRTLWPSLGLDVLVAVALVLNEWIGSADILSGAAWATLGVLVAKSVIASIASFVLRLRVAPAQ